MIDVRVVTIDRYPSGQTYIWNNLPNVRYKFVLNDKGEASWDVPLSYTPSPEHPESQALTADAFGPLASDYRIGVNWDGIGWETVHEGIVGPVGMKSDEQIVKVQGYDYLWWLDQPYHFSGYPILDPLNWNPTTDVVRFWPVNTNQRTIITDLLTEMYTTALQSVRIQPVFEGEATSWTQVLFKFMMLGDTTTVLDTIKAIGELNEPYGFEFWMEKDKFLHMASPRRVTQAAAAGIEIASFRPSSGSLIDIDWTNSGPKAISTVGIPPEGIALHGYSTYTPSKDTYRNWLEIVNFNDAFRMRKQSHVNAATDSVGTLHRYPQKTLSITIKPDAINGDELFFHRSQVGNYVYVDSEEWFKPYHRIQAWFKITSQELLTDNASNWTCKLTLDQVYA